MFMVTEKFMQTALRLARKGRGRVSPNPMVGAVIVKNGKIVGKGWHKKFGETHAEVNALAEAGSKARHAELYVNLEPCSHFGKQPPCVNAIIDAGIRKVVCAMKDPNPLVAGKGINRLKRAGIIVETGLLKEKAKDLNKAFVKWVLTGKPFVTLKIAMTENGFISWGNGKRKKITEKESLQKVQELRAEHDAVLVGINTVLKDNPKLSNRSGMGEQPAKIILDSNLKIPLDSKIIKGKGKIIIFHSGRNIDKERKLKKKEVDLEKVKGIKGKIPIQKVLQVLGKKGITSLLVEGGQEINTSFIEEGKADKLVLFMSKKNVKNGMYFVKILKNKNLLDTKATKIKNWKIQRKGKDLMLDAYF